MLRDVAYAPAIHAASHVDHEKRDARISVSMHACGSVHIVMGLRLVTLSVAEAPLTDKICVVFVLVSYVLNKLRTQFSRSIRSHH